MRTSMRLRFQRCACEGSLGPVVGYGKAFRDDASKQLDCVQVEWGHLNSG